MAVQGVGEGYLQFPLTRCIRVSGGAGFNRNPGVASRFHRHSKRNRNHWKRSRLELDSSGCSSNRNGRLLEVPIYFGEPTPLTEEPARLILLAPSPVLGESTGRDYPRLSRFPSWSGGGSIRIAESTSFILKTGPIR